MPQLNRSETQRPRTAPASHGASSLDLGHLHQALPHAPLLLQQNRRTLLSSSPRQQTNVHQATRSLPFTQRTPKRPSKAESSRVATFPRRPSTCEGSRAMSSQTRWEGPTLAGNNRLFSIPGKSPRKPGDPPASTGRKTVAPLKLSEQDETLRVARLPPDLLCQCFISIESLYYLVSCASVCRSWREALLTDLAEGFRQSNGEPVNHPGGDLLEGFSVWKTMYLKWWHSVEAEESLGVQTRKDTRIFTQDIKTLPGGHNSWRSAFLSRFQEGKKELVRREKAWAVREGYLHIRQVLDTHDKRAFDCAQGDAMLKLAEHLGLTFSIRLNRGQPTKIQGKGKVDIFQNSCIVRYPATCIGNLDLAAFKSIEALTKDQPSGKLAIIAAAGKTCAGDCHQRQTPASRLPLATWEVVSTTSRSPGPLRLVQHCITHGVSVIVGTLAEESILPDGVNGEEQVLVIVVSLHLSGLLWKLMDLGEGPSSHVARRVVQDQLDPHYGLHGWHVSVQFHTFGRHIWSRNFVEVFWNQSESVPGEKAVFLLISQHEVFPGILKLPWKGEAFSGTLRGVYMLDITLWDGGGEIAWQNSSAVRIDPAPLAVVEYGIGFDGERVHTHVVDKERGVSVAINMCIPLSVTNWQVTTERPVVAITDLKVGLTNKFLENWCGVANI